MAKNGDSYSAPSMVPERDEVMSRGSGVRRGASSARTMPRENVARERRGSTSGGVRFLLSVLVLGLLVTGGAGYFFYMENQAIKIELAQAGGRLQSLENRLSAVGESSEETTLKMNEKINLNFSEIDKLWAARRSMLPDLEANQAAVAALQTTSGELETALGTQAGRVNALTTQQTNMENRIETITGNIANLDRFSQQLESMNQELTRLRAEVDAMESLASRMEVSEQDIESINVHRLQVNQSLNTMQEQIRVLQIQIGQ